MQNSNNHDNNFIENQSTISLKGSDSEKETPLEKKKQMENIKIITSSPHLHDSKKDDIDINKPRTKGLNRG